MRIINVLQKEWLEDDMLHLFDLTESHAESLGIPSSTNQVRTVFTRAKWCHSERRGLSVWGVSDRLKGERREDRLKGALRTFTLLFWTSCFRCSAVTASHLFLHAAFPKPDPAFNGTKMERKRAKHASIRYLSTSYDLTLLKSLQLGTNICR